MWLLRVAATPPGVGRLEACVPRGDESDESDESEAFWENKNLENKKEALSLHQNNIKIISL